MIAEREQGRILLLLARNAIAEALDAAIATHPEPAWLDAPGATFVTVTSDGDLRGCVGSLNAERPLRVDVRANATAAAFRDPRFSPVETREFAAIALEVSLLSPLERLPAADRGQAVALLRPGVDGVVFEFAGRRATYLPQVWEHLPDPADFLSQLALKAGLPAGFWDGDVRLWRYTVAKWRERDYLEPGARRMA